MSLERFQVWVYLGAVAVGLAVGHGIGDGVREALDIAVLPLLALLLYATFTQVDLLHVRVALRDRRFLLAAVFGNFVLVPAVVWASLGFLPDDPAVRLGVLLVFLVPCTDWVITFTQLGRGDTPRAISITPINLVLQILSLPVYLWLMAPDGAAQTLSLAEVWPAIAIVLGPLIAAYISERWWWPHRSGPKARELLGWGPVPLLALVLFCIAAAELETALESLNVLAMIVPYAIGFLVAMLLAARLLATTAGLSPRRGRTLAFTLGTRNSFVVLPIALALPAGWEVAVVVIVTQSLVELLGMIAYLWLVPRYIFPEPVSDRRG